MQKIKVGKDVLRFVPSETSVEFGKGDCTNKILRILKEAERPLSISEIGRLVGIKSWIKAKSETMDLVIAGKVEVFKSGRQYLFRIKRETSNSQSKTAVK